MLSLVSCSGTCLRRCSQEDNSLQHLNRSRCRRIPLHAIRSTHGTDLLICAPGLKGHFTHAVNVEVASDRSNHDCVSAAARLTRSGGFFYRMDFLLGTLRRHVSTLTTVPTSLGSIRSHLCLLLCLLTALGLGLRSSRGSTHTCHMTNLHTFSARFVRVRAVCRSVISVSAPGTCLLSLIVTFASSFRSLATLA